MVARPPSHASERHAGATTCLTFTPRSKISKDTISSALTNVSCWSRPTRKRREPLTGSRASRSRGNLLLPKGTAIATFTDGAYKNRPHGNHAALYLSQDQGGLWVIDQWKDDDSKHTTITRHYLRFKGVNKDGGWVDTSNNGDAFSVIE